MDSLAISHLTGRRAGERTESRATLRRQSRETISAESPPPFLGIDSGGENEVAARVESERALHQDKRWREEGHYSSARPTYKEAECYCCNGMRGPLLRCARAHCCSQINAFAVDVQFKLFSYRKI